MIALSLALSTNIYICVHTYPILRIATTKHKHGYVMKSNTTSKATQHPTLTCGNTVLPKTLDNWMKYNYRNVEVALTLRGDQHDQFNQHQLSTNNSTQYTSHANAVHTLSVTSTHTHIHNDSTNTSHQHHMHTRRQRSPDSAFV